MARTKEASRVRPGDVVIVEGHRVGDSRRLGEIIEVIGEPDHEHYRVRWEDGRETVFYPSSDATIRPGRAKKGKR
jgi:translation initiation factor IF-1